MRAVIQRVRRAAVSIAGEPARSIEAGVVVLLGVGQDDSGEDAVYIADKIAHLRIFPDEEGKMNRSLVDIGGSALVVSQFTLYGDVRRGRRPSFVNAADPQQAVELYERVAAILASRGIPVQTGWFQEHMLVEIENDGPVTILVDSRREF